MAMENPYRTPNSDVAETGPDAFQPVRIFSVSGRIGRVRYIAYTFGLTMLVSLATAALAALLPFAGGVLLIVSWISIIAISLILSIQRAHDFNVSGWLALLGLVPLVNLLFWFVPGTDGPNRYGHATPPNSVGTIVVASIIPAIFVI